MNPLTAGGHFVFFRHKFSRGPSNSPPGASNPKIPPKPLNNIHLKIQTLKYQVTQTKTWKKSIFLKILIANRVKYKGSKILYVLEVLVKVV